MKKIRRNLSIIVLIFILILISMSFVFSEQKQSHQNNQTPQDLYINNKNPSKITKYKNSKISDIIYMEENTHKTGLYVYKNPILLGVDDFQNVYILDRVDQRILIYDKNNNYIKSFGKAGVQPKDFINVISGTIYNNYIYILDDRGRYQNIIHKFNMAGDYLNSIFFVNQNISIRNSIDYAENIVFLLKDISVLPNEEFIVSLNIGEPDITKKESNRLMERPEYIIIDKNGYLKQVGLTELPSKIPFVKNYYDNIKNTNLYYQSSIVDYNIYQVYVSGYSKRSELAYAVKEFLISNAVPKKTTITQINPINFFTRRYFRTIGDYPEDIDLSTSDVNNIITGNYKTSEASEYVVYGINYFNEKVYVSLFAWEISKIYLKSIPPTTVLFSQGMIDVYDKNGIYVERIELSLHNLSLGKINPTNSRQLLITDSKIYWVADDIIIIFER